MYKIEDLRIKLSRNQFHQNSVSKAEKASCVMQLNAEQSQFSVDIARHAKCILSDMKFLQFAFRRRDRHQAIKRGHHPKRRIIRGGALSLLVLLGASCSGSRDNSAASSTTEFVVDRVMLKYAPIAQDVREIIDAYTRGIEKALNENRLSLYSNGKTPKEIAVCLENRFKEIVPMIEIGPGFYYGDDFERDVTFDAFAAWTEKCSGVYWRK